MQLINYLIFIDDSLSDFQFKVDLKDYLMNKIANI
jgi:hypothetical protein